MFRLRVLGGLALEGSGGAPVSTLHHRRAMAVLAVLAVHGDLGCSRERLLALLWPESDEAHARHGLRDALHAIRHALPPGSLQSVTSLLRLDASVVGSDVMEFTRAVASGSLADAARQYGGPLLDGFHLDNSPEFEYWLAAERARLARECVEAFEGLAISAEGRGAWAEAARWWARAVEHDPLNSHFMLHQMQALSAIGDRANAIQAGEHHLHRLGEEFGLEPDPSVLATIERIRRGELPAPHDGVSLFPPALPIDPPTTAHASSQPLGPPNPPDRARIPAGTPPTAAVPWMRRWWPWAMGIMAVALLAAAVRVGRWLTPRVAETRAPRTAIAVLPFRNLSADSTVGFFAGGLHDELQTQLTKVASLRVVGRTSVGGYEGTSKSLRQIGEELGVGSIVEASVQVVGTRLRVTVQLLDPVTQADLWAERYDRTLDDAFVVQSDIARRIVAAVGATLTSAEAGALAAAPTRDPQAYQLYLQGLDYQRRPGLLRQNLEIAQQLYERSLALDSAFAPAHAASAFVHWYMLGLGYDGSAAGRLELAGREADAALRLGPDLPQAHLAAGIARYFARGNFRRALDEFNLGLRSAPNDADLWKWTGLAHRCLGNGDSTIAAFNHARRLSPRDADLLHDMGDSYHFLHRYREAIDAYRLELAFAPDLVQSRLSLAWSYVLWKGELDTLRAVLQGLPPDGEPGHGGNSVVSNRLALAQLEQRPDSVLSLVRALRPPMVAGAGAAADVAYWTEPAYRLRGDTAAARAVLESAAVELSARERARPNEYGVHASRGLVLAKLGRRAEALREDRWIAQSEEAGDVCHGDKSGSALILATAGDTDAALAAIERLLSRPSLTSVHMLRLDPNWDPIRSNPRFQALLMKYAEPGK